MPIADSGYYFSESSLDEQIELEQASMELARRLTSLTDRMCRDANPELLGRYRKVASESEGLYRYCRRMLQTVSDMQVDGCVLVRQIGDLLDETYYELTRHHHQNI